ncbi:MAG: type IV pilus twitching motility protein PilT [Acidimicrobiia bacterium]
MAIDESRLEHLLRQLRERRGSDLHLKVGTPPRMRIDGSLRPVGEESPTAEDLERLAHLLLPKERAAEFEVGGEADFALDHPGVGRFRVNVYRQRGTVALVFRAVAPDIPRFPDLGLPPVVQRLADERRGLVLVTGPTGSGKTTTLASMIDHINETRPVNIVTIEDPVEVVHKDTQAIVSQREIGADTRDFAQAMRRVLRQDPDVILVGEMRDAETVWAGLAAAETGHLVLSTLHTADTVDTVNRLVDFFPPAQHNQIRLSLATSLRGIVSQRLLERADGGGRVPAIEVLVNTGRVAERIIDPHKSGDSLGEVLADGDYYGMQTFDQSLLRLYRDGLIDLRTALEGASNPSDLRVAIQRAGLPAA